MAGKNRWFEGEVLRDSQKGRWPGARIKHRMKHNWLKMYDKFGWVLRIDTVINDPREFRVLRLRARVGRGKLFRTPLHRRHASLQRRGSVCPILMPCRPASFLVAPHVGVVAEECLAARVDRQPYVQRLSER